MKEKEYLEIQLDRDKRDIAAILVANGYSVCLETVSVGKGRGKKMLAFWKEDKEKKDE
jgi:hypothetical protein